MTRVRTILLVFTAMVSVVLFGASVARAQSPTVVYSDSFTSTSDLNANWCNSSTSACPIGSLATAITCPSGAGFTLTTCAQIAVPSGYSGNNLLVPCFVSNTAGCPSNGFNLTSYDDWYVYEEVEFSSGANFGSGNFKFIYNKNSGAPGAGYPVGVCYYDGIVNSEGPLNVALRTICDEDDQPGNYVNVNLTTGSKHYIEEHYTVGGTFDIRFDGTDLGSYPSGANLQDQAMTDTEIGLYLNGNAGSSFDVVLSNFQICTGNWCSAGTSGSGASESGSTGSAPAPVSVVVSPAAASVTVGATQQMTATVTGSTTAPAWSTTDPTGNVTSEGLYTAGTKPGNYAVTASASGVSANTAVTVTAAQPTVAVSISPTSANVQEGATQQFTVSVTGTSAAPTWTATAGTISSTGLFTAPNTTGTVTITATNGGVSASATATVTAPAPVTVTVSPTTASVRAGATQQFTAKVTGTTNAVTWSASGGSISSTGLYTAPSNAGTYTVTASDAGATASAAVTGTVATSVCTLSIAAPSIVQIPNTVTVVATQANCTGSPTFAATGDGTINSSTGVFTPDSAAGTATVTASIGSTISNTLAITVEAPSISTFLFGPEGFESDTWAAWGGGTPAAGMSITSARAASGTYSAVEPHVNGTGSTSWAETYFGDLDNAALQQTDVTEEFDSWFDSNATVNVNGGGGTKINIMISNQDWTTTYPQPLPYSPYYLTLYVNGNAGSMFQVWGELDRKTGGSQVWQEFGPNTSSSGVMPLGQWVHFKVRTALNTPGSSNGILQVWMNGTQIINYTNVDFRDSYTMRGWNMFEITGYDNAPPTSNWNQYWDNVEVYPTSTSTVTTASTAPAPACTVSISAPSSVQVGSTITFKATTANCTGTPSFSASGDGTINAATGVFTPGSAAGTATVTAYVGSVVSNAVTVTVTVPVSSVSVHVAPTGVTLLANQKKQFTATVTGSTAAPSWTATCGTVTSTGLYTAPSTAGTCTVNANVAGVAASATVRVQSSRSR